MFPFVSGLTLQKKWKGLRDGFVREMKKKKNAPSGSGAASKTSYIYFNRLMFLERSVNNKSTESNISTDIEQNSSVDGEDVMRPPPTSGPSKKKKISAADAEFLSIIQKNVLSGNQSRPCITEENDDDKLFCLSLHKELLKVPESNRLETKIALLHVLQNGQQGLSQTPSPTTTRPGYMTPNDHTQYSTQTPISHHSTPSFQSTFPNRYFNTIVQREQGDYYSNNSRYNPTPPSVSSNLAGYTTRTVQREQEAYNSTPSPVSTIGSQESDCIDLFQN